MSRKEVKEYNAFIQQLLPFLGSSQDITDKGRRIYDYIAYMLDRTQQMFIYTGLPDTIPARCLELLLQVNGYACITDVPGKGLYAFFGGLGGVPDPYYMPTECIVNNPALDFNKVLQIGTDCIIVRNDDMFSGLMPMYKKYAGLLAESDITFRVASINARLTEVLSASDDATKAAAEKYLKDIESGKLGVIGESTFFDGVKLQAGSSDSATRFTDLIEYHQYLKAGWFNDLGIQAAFNMKREALNSDEVQLNIKALLPLAENMLECRKEGIEKINALYGTNIRVDFRSVWKDTQEEIEQADQLDGDPQQEQQDPEPEQEEQEQTDNEQTN